MFVAAAAVDVVAAATGVTSGTIIKGNVNRNTVL